MIGDISIVDNWIVEIWIGGLVEELLFVIVSLERVEAGEMR